MEFGLKLQAAESVKRASLEAGLKVMAERMNSIAHVSEGDVQHLIEQEALELNRSLLTNRYILLQP